MTIGDRIKARRKELGMTQLDLGKKLGVSKSAICKAEYSKNDMTTDRIENFANALNCTSAYLFGWEDIAWNPKTQEIDISYELSEEETMIIEMYRKADATQKELVQKILNYMKG